MSGFDSKLSPRLNVSGHVGWGFVNSYQTGQSVFPSGLSPTTIDLTGIVPFTPQVGTANSLLADVALSYQLMRATKVSLTAAQAVVPTTFGQLQKSDVVGINVAHDINQWSSLSFSAQFSFIPATQGSSLFGGQTGSSEFFSASVGYSYQLAREWRSNLSYTYRERNDNTGIVRSSTVLFALARTYFVGKSHRNQPGRKRTGTRTRPPKHRLCLSDAPLIQSVRVYATVTRSF